MLRGFYTAAAGMLSQMQRQEMITNNLANVRTPGYKADQGSMRSFPQELLKQIGGNEPGRPVGGLSTGVYLQETIPNFTQGSLKATNKSTDLALVSTNMPVDQQTGKRGALFFTVKMPDGSYRYTKNGSFSLDPFGRLETSTGQLVMDQNGQPITITSDQFNVDADGRVYENGQNVARLGIAYAANPYTLVKEGSGLFRAGNGNPLPQAQGNPSVTYQIKQGFLESSNVSAEKAMTDLMMTYRTFEANQKVLKAYDHTMDLAANQVGRIG